MLQTGRVLVKVRFRQIVQVDVRRRGHRVDGVERDVARHGAITIGEVFIELVGYRRRRGEVVERRGAVLERGSGLVET